MQFKAQVVQGGVVRVVAGQLEPFADMTQAQQRRLATRCGWPAPWHEGRRGIEQRAGVGLLGAPEDLPGRGVFDLLTLLQHQQAVGAVTGHAQIMGDDQQRDATLGDQQLQVIENTPLHGHVQRTGGLVSDDQPWLAGQGDGNQHPLAHAAGQLMRVLPRPQHRLVKADLVQQRQHLGLLAWIASSTRQLQRLGDLLADPLGGVKADHWVLRHQADGAPAQLAPGAFSGLRHIDTIDP